MKLSAPIHELKSRAKSLKNAESLSLNQALDRIALEEGFSSWSLLHSKMKAHLPKARDEVLTYLNPGDLMLLGSRPGLGKTKMAMNLMIQAAIEEREAYLFSLEFTDEDVVSSIEGLGNSAVKERLHFDFSDEVSSDYIIRSLDYKQASDSLIVIDYLQLLDQKRHNPALQEQIVALKLFAEESGCVIIFLSQIDRNFDGKDNDHPEIKDIRMPNYFDVELFNKVVLFDREKMMFLKPKRFEVS